MVLVVVVAVVSSGVVVIEGICTESENGSNSISKVMSCGKIPPGDAFSSVRLPPISGIVMLRNPGAEFCGSGLGNDEGRANEGRADEGTEEELFSRSGDCTVASISNM